MREIFPFSTRNTSIPNKKYPSPHAPNGTNLRCPFMVAYRWGWRGQEKVKAELNNFYWSFESCHIRDWMHIEMTSNNHLFSKIQNINDKLYQIQYGLALKIESHSEVVFFKSQLWLRLITNIISAEEIPTPKFSFAAMDQTNDFYTFLAIHQKTDLSRRAPSPLSPQSRCWHLTLMAIGVLGVLGLLFLFKI